MFIIHTVKELIEEGKKDLLLFTLSLSVLFVLSIVNLQLNAALISLAAAILCALFFREVTISTDFWRNDQSKLTVRTTLDYFISKNLLSFLFVGFILAFSITASSLFIEVPIDSSDIEKCIVFLLLMFSIENILIVFVQNPIKKQTKNQNINPIEGFKENWSWVKSNVATALNIIIFYVLLYPNEFDILLSHALFFYVIGLGLAVYMMRKKILKRSSSQ